MKKLKKTGVSVEKIQMTQKTWQHLKGIREQYRKKSIVKQGKKSRKNSKVVDKINHRLKSLYKIS